MEDETANNTFFAIPLKKFTLGSFETEVADLRYDPAEKEFMISFINKATKVRHSTVFKTGSISKIEQHYEIDNRYIRLLPRPTEAQRIAKDLPEGFDYCFHKNHPFVLQFSDQLDDFTQHKLSNLLSSVAPFAPESLVASQESEPDIDMKDNDEKSLVRKAEEYIHPDASKSKRCKEGTSDTDDKQDCDNNAKVSDQHLITKRSLRSRSNVGKNYSERDGRDYLLDDEDIPAFILSEKPDQNENIKPRLSQHPGFEKFDDIQELLNYPPGSNIIIKMEDYKCLDRRDLLSDVVLDFFLQYVLHQRMTSQQRDKIHIYNSQFYNIYATSSNFAGWKGEDIKNLSASEKRYLRVQSYFPCYEELNIFEKDYIVFPCLDNEHWFLAIVCNPKLNGSYSNVDNSRVDVVNGDLQSPITSSCILVFDSVKSNPGRRTKAINHIRTFLTSEYKAKHQKDFPFVGSDVLGHHVASPYQSNATDCGLYVLEFFEQFFIKAPLQDYRPPIDLRHWFDKSIILNKRKEIAETIQQLIKEESLDGSLPELPPISFVDESKEMEYQDSDCQEVEMVSFEVISSNGVGNNENGNNGNTSDNNNEEVFNNNNDFNARDNNKSCSQNTTPAKLSQTHDMLSKEEEQETAEPLCPTSSEKRSLSAEALYKNLSKGQAGTSNKVNESQSVTNDAKILQVVKTLSIPVKTATEETQQSCKLIPDEVILLDSD